MPVKVGSEIVPPAAWPPRPPRPSQQEVTAIILVDVRLDGPADRELNGEMLVDLLWAHARPDHCITHISVTAKAGRADLVLFVTLADEERLRGFIANALTRGAGTQDWTVRK